MTESSMAGRGIDDNPIAEGVSFEVAYDEYAHRGLRYAYSMLRHTSDAEEVVQDAFCRLLGPQRRPLTTESFPAIFFVTIRNLSIDTLRRRKRNRNIAMQQLTANPRNQAADSNLAALRDAIQLFMGELPENWADALRLRIEGQLSYEEIAQTLECTQAQVRTWIYRARRQLEEELRHSGLLAGECQS